MVRLNGRVALHSNNSEEDIGAGTTNRRFFPKKIGFFQLLGFTMMALKLKEHWDEYRKVPSDPVAANNGLAPPAYRDDDYDTESAIGLDTSIIMPTRTTRRKRSCCVCCGLNCGLFCKALGIVVLIFTLWNGFKLAKWLLTPSPTGLENMPEFSKSLGCLDATHFYQDNKDGVFYTIPVGSDVGHDLVIGGGAVGTIVIAPATDINDHSIKVRASLRTSDSRLLNSVEVHTPESSPLPSSQAPGTSYFDLLTPTQSEEVDTCMRYDLTVYIPVTLRTLRISSRSIAQVKLDFDDTPRELYDLRIELVSSAAANLLIPSAGLLADNVDIDMRGGYLVGKLPIANATTIDTSKGDTITKVDLFTSGYELPESDEDTQSHGDAAHLYTLTGTGRTDVTYENRAMRPIRSEHVVTTYKPRESELRLTYQTSGFNGNIDLDAPSYSLRNVQSSGRVGGMDENREFWVGDKKGSDHLKIVTPGWVGLYF